MNLVYIILIIAVVVIVLLLSAVVTYKYDKISFKEALDLTDLPIITFVNNGKRLNFLLDTGANKSIINSKELKHYTYTTTEVVTNLTGMDGISRQADNVNMIITYKNNDYVETFQATDMSPAFDKIKQATGVSIQGLLGNAFFQKYKYILDFNELVAYSKRKK